MVCICNIDIEKRKKRKEKRHVCLRVCPDILKYAGAHEERKGMIVVYYSNV